MTEIVLFHHAQGLTSGVRGFAERLQQSGHVVHVPDLYEGHTFDSLEAGLDYARTVGFNAIAERGLLAAEALPAAVVYGGFSLGVLPAQRLAQTRTGAKGALLFESFVPVTEFSPTWPASVPVQIHGLDADEFFVGDGDVEVARALVASTPSAELFLYPGKAHLFADNSLPTYDESAAGLLTERVLSFLATNG
jgi:dienelactone hydrolase